ncbi:MAG: AAA family ATPase, partial [Candidatus Helarchaeota archaeon]
ILKKRIKNLLNYFDIEDRANELMETFSRGMIQKVCLCAALINDPKILFLDEPTSNLDPHTSKLVIDFIVDFVKKNERTVFLSTHLLNNAENFCDEIAIINQGSILIRGSLDKILKASNADNLEECYFNIINDNKIN